MEAIVDNTLNCLKQKRSRLLNRLLAPTVKRATNINLSYCLPYTANLRDFTAKEL